VKNYFIRNLIAITIGLLAAPHSQAEIILLAVGTLDQSRAGSFADLSGLKYTLENGAPANSLGGFGSAIAYASGNTFLALPDRGPNAVTFDPAIDNTAATSIDSTPSPWTWTPTQPAQGCRSR
jgi:hypothetical protein